MFPHRDALSRRTEPASSLDRESRFEPATERGREGNWCLVNHMSQGVVLTRTDPAYRCAPLPRATSPSPGCRFVSRPSGGPRTEGPLSTSFCFNRQDETWTHTIAARDCVAIILCHRGDADSSTHIPLFSWFFSRRNQRRAHSPNSCSAVLCCFAAVLLTAVGFQRNAKASTMDLARPTSLFLSHGAGEERW